MRRARGGLDVRHEGESFDSSVTHGSTYEQHDDGRFGHRANRHFFLTTRNIEDLEFAVPGNGLYRRRAHMSTQLRVIGARP